MPGAPRAELRPAGARVSAVRPRVVGRVPDAGLVGLADGSEHAGGRSTRISRFWRQMLRWITSDSPERVVVSLPTDRPTRGRRSRSARRSPTACSSRATTRRSSRTSRATAASTRDLPLDWAIDRDGEYRGTFTPDQAGHLHRPASTATLPIGRGGRRHEPTCASRTSTPSTSTPRCARRCSSASRRRRADGSTRPATATTLAEDVAMSKHGVTVVNQMDLWDMPAIFLLLVAARERGVGVSEVAGARMRTAGRLDGWTARRRLSDVRRVLRSCRVSVCRGARRRRIS